MRVLVVHSHPVAESYNRALADQVVFSLGKAGHEVRFLDLYAEGFDPVMSREDRLNYHERGLNEAKVAGHLAHIKWCEALVLVYPTWWYGLPAMLKGWLERVWVPHATFSMPEGNQPIRPLMQHIRRLAIVTTYGSPWWWIQVVGDPGVRTVMRGIRALCAKRCHRLKLAHYRMDDSTPESRARFLAKVGRVFASY